PPLRAGQRRDAGAPAARLPAGLRVHRRPAPPQLRGLAPDRRPRHARAAPAVHAGTRHAGAGPVHGLPVRRAGPGVLMRRWLVVAVLLAASLLAWVAAGPWLTMHAIGKAVREEDHAALARHIDFPPLRASLKDQLGDRLARSVGVERQTGLLGALGMTMANELAGGA